MARRRLWLLIAALTLCTSAIWAQESPRQGPGRLQRQPAPAAREASASRSMTKDCGSTDVCCVDTPTSGTCCAWLFGHFLGCWRDY